MPTAYSPRAGSSNPEDSATLRMNFPRRHGHPAVAIARIRLASACALMRQIEEYLQHLRNNGVGFPAFDDYYKADTRCATKASEQTG